MASRTVVLIPSDGTNIIQSGQVFPGTFVQPVGAQVQYVHYGGQQPGISHNTPQQISRMNALEKLLNVETKTLGAIQIMIGLIHIGFGMISCLLIAYNYVFVTGLGYTFWGGLFVRCSVGMNITSAVIASISIILYVLELALNSLRFNPFGSQDVAESELSKSVGTGIAVLLLLFSLLEFCITVSAAHFGCKAACCNSDIDTMPLISSEINGRMVDSAGSNLPPPPEFNSVDSASIVG